MPDVGLDGQESTDVVTDPQIPGQGRSSTEKLSDLQPEVVDDPTNLVPACWGDSVGRDPALMASGGAATASITRSLVQQALLQAVDWKAVHCALMVSDSSAAARLLQVCLGLLIVVLESSCHERCSCISKEDTPRR